MAQWIKILFHEFGNMGVLSLIPSSDSVYLDSVETDKQWLSSDWAVLKIYELDVISRHMQWNENSLLSGCSEFPVDRYSAEQYQRVQQPKRSDIKNKNENYRPNINIVNNHKSSSQKFKENTIFVD